MAIISIMNANTYINSAQKYGIDAFSQVLNLLKLDASIYHNAKVCGNWKLNEHTLGATCFHMVTIGSCLLDVPNHLKLILRYGDLVIFPRELAHSMVPDVPLAGDQRHLSYQLSQSIDGTGLMCGEMRFQHAGSQFILDALPPVFIIQYDATNDWLKSLLEMILGESMRESPASKVLLDKLSELLFTYALRQYLMEHPKEVGMLAIYGHSRLSKVIEAIHQHPEREWTLELMAKEAAFSRTTFVETFKSVSGWTPGQYLTWWRMQLAWTFLKEGEKTAEVANKVGYHSDSAFSRVFQKTFSIAAGKVRRGERATSGTTT